MKKLINRPEYLRKLNKFRENGRIKVLTGARRSGKSSILELFKNQLLNEGIDNEQILFLNFELYEYSEWSLNDFYQFIKNKSQELKGKKLFLFLDEIQNLEGWEKAVNSFRIEFNVDIYITGSNAYLMSSNLTTLLSGRTNSIQIFPLSFQEYCNFLDLIPVRDSNSLKLNKWSFKDSNVDINILLNNYIKYGGFPGLVEANFDDFIIRNELNELLDLVVYKDIISARLNSTSRAVNNSFRLVDIIKVLASNIGSLTSKNKLVKTLDFIEKNSKSNNYHTVNNYIDALISAFIIYPVSHYDLKGRNFLIKPNKYYFIDSGLRNFILKFPEEDTGHLLENVVFLELMRRDFQISTGRYNENEIDFVVSKNDQIFFIQVTYDLGNPGILERETKILKKIKDNGQKIIITGNPYYQSHYTGIKIISILDFLLDDRIIYEI